MLATPASLFWLLYPGQGAGGLEGLQLVVKYNYIKGIFALSCIFMVEIAILDYTTKVTSPKSGSFSIKDAISLFWQRVVGVHSYT